MRRHSQLCTLTNFRIMLRHFALSVALLVAAPTFGQDPLTPGNPAIDTSMLAAFAPNYIIHVKQGSMEQNIGAVAFTLSIDEEAGQIEAIRAYEMMGQKLADTLVAAWPSLASISHVSNNPQRTLRFTVSDGMITGARNVPGEEPETFEMSVDGPVFDSSWMSTLARTLPLEDGYETTVTAFEDDEAGIGDYSLTTAGPATLELPNGQKYDVWEVAAVNPSGETVRYFYSTSDRSLLRIAMNPQPGLEVFIDAEMGEGK